MATIDVGGGRGARQPEAVEKGTNVVALRISLSVTISAGDIHRIGKLPHGAIPLDAIFYTGSAFTDSSLGHVLKMGTSASADMFFTSDTYSAGGGTVYRTSRRLGLAMQISLSDDFMPRYENVVMVASGMSVGHIGDLVLYYKMPGQTL
jgi:hypothetical protein